MIQIFVLWVHQEDLGHVIETVSLVVLTFVHLSSLYFESFETLCQFRVIRGSTSHADDVLTKVRQIVFQSLGRISFRIDRYKDYFKFEVGTLRHVSDDSVHGRQVVERTRTDVR